MNLYSCKDCFFWERSPKKHIAENWGECTAGFLFDMTTADKEFYTTENFGCVIFEKKEENGT